MAARFDARKVSTWARGLWAGRLDKYHTVAYAIARRMEPDEMLLHKHWKMLLKDDLLRIVLDLLCEKCLCGFSFEELTNPSDWAFRRRNRKILVSNFS